MTAKERLILGLLGEHGELYGLQLVERSGGKLKRGTVYVRLDRLADRSLVGSRVVATDLGPLKLPLRVFFETPPGGTGERAEPAGTTLQLQGATTP